MHYKYTYDSEIFKASQCIWHENSLVDLIRSHLILKGYQPVDNRHFVWIKEPHRIFLVLVDDIENLNYQQHEDFLSTFTPQDTIITDNWINRPTRAKVMTLPNSWFGIYSCRPTVSASKPTKSWCMPVNRIDYNRTMIMLEMHHQGYIDSSSLVNFNCARHTDSEDTADQKNLWLENWDNIDIYYKERYQNSFDHLTPLMPFRNHDLSFDQMMSAGSCQIVLETYAGDHSVALSEKTFRALVTPRLWRIFGGTWTVARLRQLGFDVMDDVIDHGTDGLKMIEDKIIKFVHSCGETWSQRTWADVESACRRAQQHNISVLECWRQQWPADFANWYGELVNVI